MRPKIKFAINATGDAKNAQFFMNHAKRQFVRWFLPRSLLYIAGKKISIPKRNKIISRYTEHIYGTNKQKILEGVKETKRRWAQTENKFYNIVDSIFQKHAWPKGKYIGYASIYFMFPRNIEEKTFYFPYSKGKSDPIRTTAHEMLHFIFFDYIKKRYGINERDKLKNKNPEHVWQISEAFNTMIENWKPYKDIFNAKKNNQSYPDCKKTYKRMSRQWAREQDIGILLDKWLKN